MRIGRRGNARRVMRFTGIAALTLTLLSGCGREDTGSSASGPRNLLVISVGSLRADHLGSYGYGRETAPTLDALARESLLFETCLAPVAATLPANVSLLTATYPLENGILGDLDGGGRPFEGSERLQSFAAHAEASGYSTAAFVGTTDLGRQSGLETGFATFDEPGVGRRSAAQTSAGLLSFLDSAGETPFFAFVYYDDLRLPATPPAPFDTEFADDAWVASLRDERGIADTAALPDGSKVTASDAINSYDGTLRYIDDQIAGVIQRLKDKGLWDSTVLVVVGDHGEGLGERGFAGHGYVWREQLHVPLLMRAADATPGKVKSPMSLTDVLPTAVAMLGGGFAEFADQASGSDVLAGDWLPAPVFSQRSARERADLPLPAFSLFDGRWKLLHEPEGEDRLYDWSADPFELRNLIDERADVADSMRTQLIDRIRSLGARATELAGGEVASGEEVDPEMIEKLKSLGYLD